MKGSRINKIKIFFLMIFIVAIGVVFFISITKLFKKPSDVFVVGKGSISYEEDATGYILRDETILQGKDTENEMVQIKYENEKVAKGDSVFRYYSKDEEDLINKIAKLNEEIDKAIAENEKNGISGEVLSDVLSIEAEIENILNQMYNTNEIRKLDEYINKIENYVSKKTQISGERSPEGSLVKKLIAQRAEYERALNTSSEIINSPMSGIVSYRVDGLEELLKVGDFSYLSKSTLDSYDVKVGTIVPQTKEKGKVVNNFIGYIATCIDTEKAEGAKVGDKVTLRLASLEEISAKIVYIVEEQDGSRILVFEIKDEIEELINYRKISFDIIWWKFSGYKISNSALSNDENDISYVKRNKVGFEEKIPIKVLRQNDTFSIVENYTEEELEELGFSEEEIKARNTLKLHDEIILH